MRLTEFIKTEMETILVEWERFAATRLPAAKHMARAELRNHGLHILEAIVVDLSTAQTEDEQSQKSRGLAPSAPSETAAQTHAILRAKSGFDINQLAAEYRALRASVLRLWTIACEPEAPRPDDVLRFNEAIDQALAESIAFFNVQVERSRNLLLGMLAHDMRNPLQAINTTAHYLAQLNARPEISRAATRLINSGAQMQRLVNDLVDFNRVQLGLGLSVTPHDIDLREVFAEAAEVLEASRPGQKIEVETSGNCRGWWDAQRLQQALGNLVVNAIDYGDSTTPVRVALSCAEDEVHFEVKNKGPAIPATTLGDLFQPLRRGDERRAGDSGLGLGLYIAREIARAHGGDIEARSDATETVFAMRLPRHGNEIHGNSLLHH